MSATLNKVHLIGNLGRDPEIRYTPNGTAVCNVSVATTSSWKDKGSGDHMEATEWHRVVFFSGLAEVVGEHLKKGRSIYVEGRLRTRKWEGKDGKDQYTTEIVGESMQMLGSKPDDTHQVGTTHREEGFSSSPSGDDDIPF